MNKRGATISYEMLMWIPRFVYLVIVILAASGLILGFVVNRVDVGAIESHILMHRLQYSREGIAAYDSYTGRVYPGIVDKSRLTNEKDEEKLAAALGAGENEMAFRFVLSDPSGENGVTAYLNEKTYMDWQPIAIVAGTDCENSEISGTGRKCPHPETRYVYSDKPARLETVVITPND